MTALGRLRELFEEWDARQEAFLAEYRDRQRMIIDIIREHDHADESRPE